MLATHPELTAPARPRAVLPTHSLAAVQAAQDCDLARLRALRASRRARTAPEPGGRGPIS